MSTNVPQQDPELLSLESSLAATEAHGIVTKRPVPQWIYYYIAFIFLVFVLAVLALINSSRPEEPVLLALHETSPKVVVAEKAPEPSPVVVEKPVEKVKEEPKPEPVAPVDPAYKYSMYTPEELTAVYTRLQSNTSDRLNIYRAEVYSLLGFYQNQAKLKSDGQYFATRCLQTNAQDLRANRAVGLSYLILGQYENARHYHDLINGKMSDSLTNWIEAELSIKDGNINLQNGFTMMEQINTANPTFYPAAYVLIQEYLHRNELAKARSIVEFWRDKSLTNLPFVHSVAELLDRQQQYVELLYYLTNFEKTYPTDWSVLFYLGKGNLKLQKKELAKGYFQKILDTQENYLADQSGNAYFELGKIQLLDNDFKKSTQNLYQASQRLPNDSAVKQYLASSYFKNEEYEKSDRYVSTNFIQWKR